MVLRLDGVHATASARRHDPPHEIHADGAPEITQVHSITYGFMWFLGNVDRNLNVRFSKHIL